MVQVEIATKQNLVLHDRVHSRHVVEAQTQRMQHILLLNGSLVLHCDHETERYALRKADSVYISD